MIRLATGLRWQKAWATRSAVMAEVARMREENAARMHAFVAESNKPPAEMIHQARVCGSEMAERLLVAESKAFWASAESDNAEFDRAAAEALQVKPAEGPNEHYIKAMRVAGVQRLAKELEDQAREDRETAQNACIAKRAADAAMAVAIAKNSGKSRGRKS
jgi:hypothetical protein